MEWIDSGIVLGVRRHGEANATLEPTLEHGLDVFHTAREAQRG